MNRRGFLAAILATATAPAIVRASSLMRVVAPLPKEYEWIEELHDWVNDKGFCGFGTGIVKSIAPQQRQLNLERSQYLSVIVNGVEHHLPLYD